MIKKVILNLLGVQRESQLSYSDKLLLQDLLSIIRTKGTIGQRGGGFSIRPELGEINGMSYRTGYLDKHPPIFVGELLRNVAYAVNGVDQCDISIVSPAAESVFD